MSFIYQTNNPDCFNHGCPFRVNETSSVNRCECYACPNRTLLGNVYSDNKTIPSHDPTVTNTTR